MKKSVQVYLVIGTVTWFFYVLMLTKNFYWDGVAFAIDIEKHHSAADLAHPSHLGYAVVSSWIYTTLLSLGLQLRALTTMQIVNTFLASGCVVLVYRWLRRLKLSQGYMIAGALLFAFSATWWRFASDSNAYVPAIFLLLCANDLRAEGRSSVAVGLLHSMAMVFHELAILLIPIWMLRSEWNCRSKLRYVLAALIPVTLLYITAYRAKFELRSLRDFWKWIVSHSPDSGFSFGPLKNLAFTLRGTARLLVGGKASDLVADLTSAAVLLISGALILTLAVTLRREKHDKGDVSDKTLQALGGAGWWATVYVAFLFFWMPQNTFYRLFYWAPFVVCVTFLASRFMSVRIFSCVVTAVVSWNFLFVAYPQSRAEFNVPLRFALEQKPKWPGGTPIAFSSFHPDLWTISYFNPQASWISLEKISLDQLNESLAYAHSQNQPLWLEETAFQKTELEPWGREWLTAHEVQREQIEFLDAKGHHYVFHSCK